MTTFQGFYAVHTKDGQARPVWVAGEGHGTIRSTGEEVQTYRVQLVRVIGYSGHPPSPQYGYGKKFPVRRSEVTGHYKTAAGASRAAK